MQIGRANNNRFRLILERQDKQLGLACNMEPPRAPVDLKQQILMHLTHIRVEAALNWPMLIHRDEIPLVECWKLKAIA